MCYLEEYRPYLRLNDQEGLNVVLAGKWGRLDPRWNQMSPVFRIDSWPYSPFREQIRSIKESLLFDPYIVHYAERAKPWHPDCQHPNQYEFLQSLRESGWFSEAEWYRWWVPLYWNRLRWLKGKQKTQMKVFLHGPSQVESENKADKRLKQKAHRDTVAMPTQAGT